MVALKPQGLRYAVRHRDLFNQQDCQVSYDEVLSYLSSFPYRVLISNICSKFLPHLRCCLNVAPSGLLSKLPTTSFQLPVRLFPPLVISYLLSQPLTPFPPLLAT